MMDAKKRMGFATRAIHDGQEPDELTVRRQFRQQVVQVFFTELERVRFVMKDGRVVRDDFSPH